MSNSMPFGAFTPSHIWPSRRHVLDEPDIITFTVLASNSPGPRHNFTIDRKLITAASPYFQRLLQPTSSVSQFMHLDIVDENPEAFKFVLYCLTFQNGKPSARDLRQLSAGRPSRMAVYVLAYVLALKLGMDFICNQIMDYILHQHDVSDVYSGALDGKTISSFPHCKVTEFLSEQLAWVLSQNRFPAFCKCAKNAVGRWKKCSLCNFKEDGSAGSRSVLAKLKIHVASMCDGSLDKGAEPRKTGHGYWHIHGPGKWLVVSCTEEIACAKCVEEDGELDSEQITTQAAEEKKNFTADKEEAHDAEATVNDDLLAEDVEVRLGGGPAVNEGLASEQEAMNDDILAESMEGGLTAEQEAMNDDILAESMEGGLTAEQEAMNDDILAESMEGGLTAEQEAMNEDLLAAICLDDPYGNAGGGNDGAWEDEMFSASDFGEIEGRRPYD